MKYFGWGQVHHQLHFFLAGVAGNVHWSDGFVDDVGTAFEQAVDGAVDVFLVTRDGMRGENHGISRLDVEYSMRSHRKFAQNRCRFTLRPGAHQHDILIFAVKGFIQTDQSGTRNFEIIELLGYFCIVDHAGTGKGHFPPIAFGCFSHLLHTRDQRSKAGDDDAAFGFAEDLVEGGIHHSFGGCPPGAFCVGRISQKSQHTAALEFSQLGIIRRPVIYRGMIEFIVPRVDDQAGRVSIPRPTESGMEWQTWKKSTENGPILRLSPAWIVCNCAR